MNSKQRSLLRSTIASLIVVSAVAVTAAADDAAPAKTASATPTQENIAQWISELDDNRYLVREQATQRLLEAGREAFAPLLAAANGDRPEPADRAVWILRKHGRSRDNEIAIAALEQLVELKGRPGVVQRADSELSRRSVAACEERLGPLGADFALQLEAIDFTNVAMVLHVRLNDTWHGTPEDLRLVAKLRQQAYFCLEGAAIDDAVVKLFEEKEKLGALQLFDTKVTPDAVNSLKAHHPTTIVYMKNQAMLGVGAVNHSSGALVQQVQPGSAAADVGIVAGDVITAIDGHKLPDFDRLTVYIGQHRPGEKVDVEILRGDQKISVSAMLGTRPKQE